MKRCIKRCIECVIFVGVILYKLLSDLYINGYVSIQFQGSGKVF
jgi:hypothetical protein